MSEEKKDDEATENVVAEAELPKTIVRRVVKDKLSQLSTGSEIPVLRDSLIAFSESARIFIHYLSATANDICKESNRQIINAEDVFKALEEIEFPEFIGPLRDSLEEFRQRNAGKKQSKAKQTNTKAKRKEPPPPEPNEGQNKRQASEAVASAPLED
ncbi:DNA polymerase II subunit B4-like [Salvia miltiorrhiza]|uniref:DNA polymerase II subunit B4-like n=1 Tax=Salvia miltiorrhiza TaxID=226208 RepID=UPI0025AD6078|nr:DNA polymerase II subunit B4-like [Salvia miltiorrhiza]XP_057807020.1 DNA polymerase II subunit B4-like [Salvia miltiorrhiza]